MDAPPDSSGQQAVMASLPHGDLPLLRAEVLKGLGDELDDSVAAPGFVRDFIAVWDARYAKLANAVKKHDQDASLDAVLSVKVTSLMLGASRLAQLSTDLEASIRTANMSAAEGLLPAIQECGQLTIERLGRCL
jgi:hypothetical protein